MSMIFHGELKSALNKKRRNENEERKRGKGLVS